MKITKKFAEKLAAIYWYGHEKAYVKERTEEMIAIWERTA